MDSNSTGQRSSYGALFCFLKLNAFLLYIGFYLKMPYRLRKRTVVAKPQTQFSGARDTRCSGVPLAGLFVCEAAKQTLSDS